MITVIQYVTRQCDCGNLYMTDPANPEPCCLSCQEDPGISTYYHELRVNQAKRRARNQAYYRLHREKRLQEAERGTA